MFPILVSIGPFKLYTLAVVAFIGFFTGLFVVWKRGKELHYEDKDLFDTVFVVLFWMFIGARIGYIAIHFLDFWDNFSRLVNFISNPGWYFPAGLISGGVAAYLRSIKHKWDMFQLMDILVTGLVYSQAIMSLGAFFAGVGYGLPTNLFFGLPFAGVYDRRIPIQLWEVLGYALCFAYLWWVEGVYRTFSWYRRNRSQAETGFLLSMYLILSGFISLISSVYRTPEMILGIIRLDLVIPGITSLGGILLLINRSGVTIGDMWGGILNYFGLGKTRHQKVKEKLEDIRELLDE